VVERRKRTERGSRKERYIEAKQDSAERTRKGEVIGLGGEGDEIDKVSACTQREQTNFLSG